MQQCKNSEDMGKFVPSFLDSPFSLHVSVHVQLKGSYSEIVYHIHKMCAASFSHEQFLIQDVFSDHFQIEISNHKWGNGIGFLRE